MANVLKGVRVPERAYTIVLWIVSVVFAAFIIGFGNLVIGDLPQVEQTVIVDDFVASEQTTEFASENRTLRTEVGAIDDQREIIQLQLDQARLASRTGEETFEAWIRTRQATTNPQQDPQVLERTRALEQLKANERALQIQIDELDNRRLALDNEIAANDAQLNEIEAAAYPAYERAQFWQEARIFGLRLLLTLPMLLVAAWLIVKQRKSDYWPLARGFVLAAVFVFFVELVPYLPSYGGYIRYGVGIVLTFIAGHFLIKNMRQYLARRQEVEAQAEDERRKLVSHDEAFKKMAAKVCPGCDRPIASMDGVQSNFCVHCGMTLFDHCHNCETRKMAFFRFCMACGVAPDEVGDVLVTPADPASPPVST